MLIMIYLHDAVNHVQIWTLRTTPLLYIVHPASLLLNKALIHNRRPRNRILRQPLVDIDLDSRIRRFIRPRDRNPRRKLPTTPTRNLDLLLSPLATTQNTPPPNKNKTHIARHIKLRPPNLARSMQRNRLGAHQVIARRDLAGDGELALAAVLVERVGAPELGARVVPLLVDLEPREARGARGGGVGDLGHVDDDGAEVVAADGLAGAGAVVGLGVHLDGEAAAGCGGGGLV